MDAESARANIRELIDLIADTRRMTMGEAAEIHVGAGLLRVYDTALPQSWFDAYCGWQANRPEYAHRAIDVPTAFVWCYDGALAFGAPYALTASAQAALQAFLQVSGGFCG